RGFIARVVLDLGHQSHVSGLLVQPFFTTAGPDVVREVGPDHFHGLDTRDNKKVLPPRRPTDQHHAISTSATRDALRRVPLALPLQSCAPPLRRSPIAKPSMGRILSRPAHRGLSVYTMLSFLVRPGKPVSSPRPTR